MKRPPLTRCQEIVFNGLRTMMKSNGAVPKHEDLAAFVGLKRSTITCHLASIEAKGYILRSRRWHDTQILTAKAGAKAAEAWRRRGAAK